MNYRVDIDGLRAVAVLPVVFSHIGLSGFSGGFVGVDIFFVISGYLITSIILSEIRREKFSLIRFYERRVRRIIPALVFVAVPSTIAAFLLLTPADFKDYSQSLAATALFVSNILFWTESSYFEAAAIYKPLLHTWSLAVEEQFYIFLPLFLMVMATFRIDVRLWIAVVCAISLALAVHMTERSAETAFFLLPFRFWELGIGSLLAAGTFIHPKNRFLHEMIPGIGLAMIAFSVFVYDESTQFPGLAALPPCLGAALIIYSGGGRSTLVSRLLSLRSVVFIGLISYSLYLWHWPISVFYQYWRTDSVTSSTPLFNYTEMLGIVATSLALAAISWRFVEQPFRVKHTGDRGVSKSFIFTTAGGALATAVAFGAMVHTGKGWPWRFTDEAVALAQAAGSSPPFSCLDTGNDRKAFETLMVMGDKGPMTTVLWGDSHAAQLGPGLHAAAERAHERLGYYGVCGCPNVVGLERIDGKQFKCNANNEWMLSKLAASPEITTVVLASRIQYYVEGTTYGPIEARQSRPILTPVGSERRAAGSQADLLMTNLGRMVDRIQAMGKRVVLVYPVPEIGRDVPKTLFRLRVVGGDPKSLSVPLQDFKERTSTTFAGLDIISNTSSAIAIRPHEILCNSGECRTMIGGDVMYRDGDHLTVEGSILLSYLFDRIFEGKRPEAISKLRQ